MGYSLYTILRPEAEPAGTALQQHFRNAGEVFCTTNTDWTRTPVQTSELAYYADEHTKLACIGFNYSCPLSPIREYLTSTVCMMAKLYGVSETIYHDGTPWKIVASSEAGRSLYLQTKQDWVACNELGVVIPTELGLLMKLLGRLSNTSATRKEMTTITNELLGLKQKIAESIGEKP